MIIVRKDYAGAEREFREAIRCNPNDASARANFGILL
jgi:Flp pilus assembly protein TadD